MRTRRGWIRGGVVALAAALGLVGCSSVEDPWKGQSGPPHVVATFPPLACFARNVGGAHVGVLTICKEEGPHEYTFRPDDARALRRANLFLANGLGLDSAFAEKLERNSGNSNLAFLQLADKLDHKLVHENDPHVWLGVVQSAAMIEQIRAALEKADPAHQDDYKKNAAAFVARLKDLHKEYRKKFKDKKNVRVVSFHDSMRYFADDYGLDVVDVIELNPGEDPSPGRMTELLKHWTDAKPEERPAVISVEPQYNAKAVDDSLLKDLEAKKITVKKVTFDPLETAETKELQDPGWYEKKMRENIEALLKALPDK
jgi:ABC-type Zn uptake system ZnuABC Zn-binding protein ZnuA